MSTRLFKDRARLIGSVYPGAALLQDADYAAKVAASQRKPTGETAAPEPAVAPAVRKRLGRRKDEHGDS